MVCLREESEDDLVVQLWSSPYLIGLFPTGVYEDKPYLIIVSGEQIKKHLPDRNKIPFDVQRRDKDLVAGIVKYRKFIGEWREAENEYIKQVRIRLGKEVKNIVRGKEIPEDWKPKKS